MADTRRLSLADRTLSSPDVSQLHSCTSREGKMSLLPHRPSPLTPPTSPAFSRLSRSSTDLSTGGDEMRLESTDSLKLRGGLMPSTSQSKAPIRSYTENGTLICSYDVEILKDTQHRDQVFGHGAWSTVCKGTCRQPRAQTSGLATPPLSPQPSPPVLVAVKKPARKDAIPILVSEARVLTHLMSVVENESYVVQFHGIITAESSLVLAAVPHSLEDYIRKCATQTQATRTTWNMTAPVIGKEKIWLDLASRLVSALSWLHNEAMVVHGDVKPGNILLSPASLFTDDEPANSIFPFTPLFADFSSSQLLDDSSPASNTLSAVTREYTAPELLSSKVLSDPKSTATTASDVFSLAVTLLVAATGNTMVYRGSVYQRQFMATQGWGVISHVRNSDDGIRLPRQGIVQRVLERAVLKDGMGRVDADTWSNAIEALKAGEPQKL